MQNNALGNPEHPGRVRGISSKLGWRDGFGEEWKPMYKKRDKYKEEMKDFFEKQAEDKFRQMMSNFFSNPDPEVLKQMMGAMSTVQQSSQAPSQMQIVQVNQPLGSQEMVTQTSTPVPSIASTTHKEHYPVDDIDRPWPCTLVISYGIRNQLTLQVATGKAIPGRMMHNVAIEDAYCKVEVETVMSGHEEDLIEIPTPEGIDKLGAAINNSILWPRRDVRLIDPPVQPSPSKVSVASQEGETFQQPPSPIAYQPSPGSPVYHIASPHNEPEEREKQTEGVIKEHAQQTEGLAKEPEQQTDQELAKEPESAMEKMPEQHTPQGKEKTATEKEAEHTPPVMQKKNDEQTPPAGKGKEKGSKWKIPCLVSPFQVKKKGAGVAKFLEGIGKKQTARLIELEPSTKQKDEAAAASKEMKEAAEASKVDQGDAAASKEKDQADAASKEAPSGEKDPVLPPLTLADIRTPTCEDYINIPKQYEHGRPMRDFCDLQKGPRQIKRFHDWYMRASHAGLHSFSLSVPPAVFCTTRHEKRSYVNFEDMFLLLNYLRLDVQLVTLFSV
jgi:hypothetical protein